MNSQEVEKANFRALREINEPNSGLTSSATSSKQLPNNNFLQPQQQSQSPTDTSLSSNLNGNGVIARIESNELNEENNRNGIGLEKNNSISFMGLMTIDSSVLPELPERLNPNFADHLRTPSRDSLVIALANELTSGLKLNETNEGVTPTIEIINSTGIDAATAEVSSDNEFFDECEPFPFVAPTNFDHTAEDISAFSSALNSKNNTMTVTQFEGSDNNEQNEIITDLDIDSLPLPPPPPLLTVVQSEESIIAISGEEKNAEMKENLQNSDHNLENDSLSNGSTADRSSFINIEYCRNVTLEADEAFSKNENKQNDDKTEPDTTPINAIDEDESIQPDSLESQDVLNSTFNTTNTVDDNSPGKESNSLEDGNRSSISRNFFLRVPTDGVSFPKSSDENNTRIGVDTEENQEMSGKPEEYDGAEQIESEFVENVTPTSECEIRDFESEEKNTKNQNESLEPLQHINNCTNPEAISSPPNTNENVPQIFNEKVSSLGEPYDGGTGLVSTSNETLELNSHTIENVRNEKVDHDDDDKASMMLQSTDHLNDTIDMEKSLSPINDANQTKASDEIDIEISKYQNEENCSSKTISHDNDATSPNSQMMQINVTENINSTFGSNHRNALNLEDFPIDEIMKTNSITQSRNLSLSPSITVKINKQTLKISNTPIVKENDDTVSEPMDIDEFESSYVKSTTIDMGSGGSDSHVLSSTSPVSPSEQQQQQQQQQQQTLSAKEKTKSNLSDEKDVIVVDKNIESPFDQGTFQSPSLADAFEFPASTTEEATKQQLMSDDFTDDDFQSDRLFLNPSDFDFLLSKGNNNVHIDRSSLLLKFDPLLGHAIPVNSNINGNDNVAPSNNNNYQYRLSPANEEDEFSIHDKNQSLNLVEESKKKFNEIKKDHKERAKLSLDSSREKFEKTSLKGSTEEENNLKISGKSVKKYAKMSVDVIQDLKIENDCKSIENNHNSQSDEKQIFKMDELEKKIKNEVLKTEDIEKKLKESEQREEALIKRITEKDKNIAKMNTVIEAYEKAIAELIAEKEQLIQKHQKELAEVKADRDSNYHHLTSLETTFSDLHVKYEKSKEMTAQLKASEEELLAEKRKNLENLRLQEQRYEKMKNHAMQQLEIANKKLETFTKNHAMESTKLKALLKKEEISRASISEQLQQKSRENEELVKICDELINGQGS